MFLLPLQSTFAAVASLCAHDANMSSDASAREVNDHLLTVQHTQLIEDVVTHAQCEVNTLCHASCSPIIIFTFFTVTPTDHSFYTSPPGFSFNSFTPEQFQRPPIA